MWIARGRWPSSTNSWVWEKFKQLVSRIRRLDSIADVNVLVILRDKTIDRKLERMNKEKGDARE